MTRIVLVHGLGRDLHDWDDVLPGLADLGECVAVDLPGFGEEPPAPDGRYSPTAHAARVATKVLADAPEPVHLVGNSLGGLVGVVAAARLPRKVATLTLVAPALPLGRATPDGIRLLLLGLPGVGAGLMRAGRRQDLDRRTRDLLKLTFARPDEVTPERYAAFRDAVAARDGVPHGDEVFTATVRGIGAQVVRPAPVRKMLAGLSMPVTALYGRHDRLVPVGQAEVVRQILPSADVRVLEHAGHLIQLEDPADVIDAVRRQVEAHAVSAS